MLNTKRSHWPSSRTFEGRIAESQRQKIQRRYIKPLLNRRRRLLRRVVEQRFRPPGDRQTSVERPRATDPVRTLWRRCGDFKIWPPYLYTLILNKLYINFIF